MRAFELVLSFGRMRAWRFAQVVLASFLATAASAHDEYVVRQWTQEHGLPQSTINAIAQDHHGYLWLGTFGGLSRFDGVRFVTFDQSDSENSCPNRILDLRCDDDGALWIASEYGGLWRHRDGRFEKWRDGTARSIAIGTDGSVYVVSQGELIVLRRDGSEFESITIPATGRLKTVEVDDRGDLWICAEPGTHRFENGRWTEVTLHDGRPIDAVQDLAFDRDGVAYLQIGNRIGVVDPGSHVVRDHLRSGDHAEKLLIDRAGTLWTSAGDELRRYRGAECIGDAGVRGHPKLGSPPLRLRATFEDPEGGLWFGTESSGLFHVQPARLEVLDEESSGVRTIGPILDDGEGGFWVGGKDTIARLRDGVFVPTHATSSTVRALARAKDGTLWAAAESELVRIAPDGRAVEHIPLPKEWSPIEVPLRALWLDENGDVWAGGTNGLFRHRADGAIERLGVEDGLNSNEVFSVMRDSRGDLWIGTDDGICRIRNGTTESFLSKVNGIPVAVRDIEEDETGALWLATYGAGLCRFADGDALWFTTADGLPDNSLSALVFDDAGRIVVTTNRGVATANLEALTSHRRNPVLTPLWSVTTAAAYRPVVEAQGGVQPAAIRSADGSIVFTIVRGLARFRPTINEPGPAEPRVRIEEIRVGAEVHRRDITSLPLGVRRVTIGYTAPRFIDPHDVRFRYRLAPVDKDWITVGTAREASYQQLAPGPYEFQVAAGTARSGWSDAVDRVAFTIPAHWHESEFVTWSLRIAIVAAIAAWFSLRVARQRSRAETLRRLFEARTRELASEIEVRKSAEAELRRHHDELDARVRVRTAELERAYRELETETAERTRLQGELVQSQKMDSLGRMASGVAHDFNNLLTAINGSAEIGEIDCGDPKAARRAFGVIRHAGEMAAQLTRQLLIFARRHPMLPIEQTFERRILDSRSLLERALGERYALRLDLASDPWQVLIPEGQIEQLLMNVVINARDAMRDGGTITIRTTKVEFSPENAANGLPPGEYAELAIADTGIGMDTLTVDHAFDPFFTTKPQGSGLGLSTCYGLVRQAGGTMRIESAPNMGTTVRVWLPRARTTPIPLPGSAVRSAPPTLDVLLVDDRDEVRTVVAMMLKSRGHRVIEATSGVEALAITEDPTVRLDVVVLDVMMPKWTGPETADRIRVHRPHLAVVFMSGNVDSDREVMEGVVTRSVFLAKPFTATDLEDRIARAIAESHANPSPSGDPNRSVSSPSTRRK